MYELVHLTHRQGLDMLLIIMKQGQMPMCVRMQGRPESDIRRKGMSK